MSAREVYSILAAGLNHPDKILQWQDHSDFLQERGVSPDSLDLEALWKFAGVAAKVRHNGLRQSFPLSFRLMRAGGLDVELFSSYATACSASGHKYANSTLQRARDLVAFLSEWREPDCTEHSLLWDIMRHELALLELKERAGVAIASPGRKAGTGASPGQRLSKQSILRAHETLILLEMAHSPKDIEAMLSRGDLETANVSSCLCYFGYWRSPQNNRIQVLELDAFSFYALSYSDGTVTLSELSKKLGGEAKLTHAFQDAIRQLTVIGILVPQTPSLARPIRRYYLSII
jgi:hypothetical protein